MLTFRKSALVLATLLFGLPLAGEKALPRILILGDQIYRQPASDLKKELKGKAEVHYPTVEVGMVWSSSTALDMLDRQLGDGQWDLIHFNCGLGDLIHRLPEVKAFRVMPIEAGGIRNTSPQQYERNLESIITRLKAAGSKIVWGNTTPIRHSSTNVFLKGSEIEYNMIAAKVMAKHGIVINDMHSFVKGLIDMNKPAGHGADPFFFDRKPIHHPILKIIAKEVDLAENLQ